MVRSATKLRSHCKENEKVLIEATSKTERAARVVKATKGREKKKMRLRIRDRGGQVRIMITNTN